MAILYFFTYEKLTLIFFFLHALIVHYVTREKSRTRPRIISLALVSKCTILHCLINKLAKQGAAAPFDLFQLYKLDFSIGRGFLLCAVTSEIIVISLIFLCEV